MRTEGGCARVAVAVLLLLCMSHYGAAHAQTVDAREAFRNPAADTVPSFDDAFRAAIEQRIAQHRGVVGLALVDLVGEQTLSVRGEDHFPSASIVKVPIMVEVFARVAEGRLALFDPLTLLASDRTGGTGILQYLSVPKELTVWDATFLMITVSDNTATNLLLEKLKPFAVNERMKSMGLEGTRVFGSVGANPEESALPDSVRHYGFGVTTPTEMAALFTRMHRGELISAEASEQMLAILSRQLYREGLPRHLPESVGVVHKTGGLDHVRNDCGIVEKPGRPFVICVMTRDNADARWTLDNEAEMLIGDIARIAYERLGAGSD